MTDVTDAIRQTPTLDARDEQMLEAILVGGTVTAAARLVGITRQTASEHVNSPEFQQALRERRGEIRAATQEALIAASKQAIDTLLGVMANPNARDSDRVSAARVIVQATIVHPQRLELVGEGGGPVRIEGLEASRAAAKVAIEELAARYEVPAALPANGNGNGNGQEAHDHANDEA